MTPDDTPIPRFDRLAGAARRGLDNLASAPGELSWEAVKSGVHRVRRRRITAIGAACTVVLLSAGAAVAATANNDRKHLRVRTGHTPTTATNTITTSTAAVDPPTTASVPDGVGGPTTTAVPGERRVQLGGLEGTLTVSSNPVQINTSLGVTLTLRNVSDHPVSMIDPPASDPQIAFLVRTRDRPYSFELTRFAVDVIVFAPGEERAFSAEGQIDDPYMIGDSLVEVRAESIDRQIVYAVAPLAIDIVPPGWTVGQLLDPSQGRWKVEMSADASSGIPGGGFTAMVHATVRNVGDQPQRTVAYGSLALVCNNGGDARSLIYHVVDAMALEPNAAATFSYGFTADPTLLLAQGMVCSVRVQLPGYSDSWAWDPWRGLASDEVWIYPPDTSGTTVPTTSAVAP
jgi:hypothetical protein